MRVPAAAWLALVSGGACVEPVLPSKPLRVESFYADAQGSIVDTARRQARDAAVAPYERFVRSMQDDADRYALSGDRAAGQCALQDLAAWARAGVLAERLAAGQAQFERAWYLGAIALGYLKVQPLATRAQRAAIEPWLAAMARAVDAYFEDPSTPRNNITFWAALGIEAAALASGDRTSDAHALTMLGAALRSIDKDGFLAPELARGRKAFDYHAFAAAPLVTLVLIAEKRHIAVDHPAVTRLVDRILEGLRAPRTFEHRTGLAQVPPETWNLAFLSIYADLSPGRALPPHPSKSHFLGGDVRATLGSIDRAIIDQRMQN